MALPVSCFAIRDGRPMVSAGAAARSTCEHDRPRHTRGQSTVARVRAVRVRPAFVDAIAFAYGMPCVLFCNRRTRCMVRVGTEVVQCVCLLRQELSASPVSRWSIRLAWPAAQAAGPRLLRPPEFGLTAWCVVQPCRVPAYPSRAACLLSCDMQPLQRLCSVRAM